MTSFFVVIENNPMQFRSASLKIAEIRRGSDGVKYINYINTVHTRPVYFR